jgi:hypothetical protein
MSLEWADAIDNIIHYSFKVTTPHASGTGFLMSFRKPYNLIVIATAYHVIDHAFVWDEPIKLCHSATGKEVNIKYAERFIHAVPDKDIAFIVISKSGLDVPEEPLTLGPADKFLRLGIDVGWTGYPFVAANEYSFFTGSVSCALRAQSAYLIDGVAINGVSGGPVFLVHNKKPHVIGIITAYIPNRATGESLPGVCYAVSVQPFYDFLTSIKSLEDAREQAENNNITVESNPGKPLNS